MKTIGCTFTMSGIYYLEEKSVCAARLKALKTLPLPENRDYLDDSLVVDDLAECMLMNDWSDAEVDALSKFSPEELIDELDSRRKGYVGIKFIDAEFTPARLKEFLLDYYGVDYDEIKTVRTDESFVEENQERCVSDTDSEGINRILNIWFISSHKFLKQLYSSNYYELSHAISHNFLEKLREMV